MSKKNKISSSRFFNARITSTVSITMVLVLLGFTMMIILIGNGLSEMVKEKISFSVMLANDVTEHEIQKLKQNIETQPFVKSMRFIGKEEAKSLLIEDLGEDPEEFLRFNPAQDAFEIYLKSDYANSDSIAKINQLIKSQNNVQDLLYREDTIDLINNNISKVTTVLLVVALLLLFISFTLIRNTIRLGIYSKRFIINTMRLVGATGFFIRKPFIGSNIAAGIIAGIFADGIIFLVIRYFSREYAEMSSVITPLNLLAVFGVVIILGVLISVVATHFAVNRYLKMEVGDLYYV